MVCLCGLGSEEPIFLKRRCYFIQRIDGKIDSSQKPKHLVLSCSIIELQRAIIHYRINPSTLNSANNYGYDELGQLIRDEQEGIAAIDWRNDGKIRGIIRASGNTERDLGFTYNPSGNRLSKNIYDANGDVQYSNYYIRDASGNVMSTSKMK